MRSDRFDHFRSVHSLLIGRRVSEPRRDTIERHDWCEAGRKAQDLASAAFLTLENAADADHAERMELGGAQCVDAGAAIDMDALRRRPAKNMRVTVAARCR